jgi:hypothetical protein
MADDPTAALQVATKRYVDDNILDISVLDARYVNVDGDTVTGNLVVGSDPGGTEVLRAQSLHAASGRVGSWRILGVINVTGNTTGVQFTNLDLSPPILLRLTCVIVNAASSPSRYNLLVNGEADSSDWATQNITGTGMSVNADRELDLSAITYSLNGRSTAALVSIVVTGDGYVLVHSHAVRSEGTDLPVFSSIGCTKNTAVTSLSNIEVVGEVTNAIGSGSVFILEYLAP